MPTPFLALALMGVRAEAPRLLIAPLAPVKKDGPQPSGSLGNHLAQEFDNDGRLTPIVWGLTDPIFRPAALEGRLGDVPTLPVRDQALSVARKLNAPYVLVYRSERKDGKLHASAELIIDGRSVWKDEKSMNAMLGNTQSDDDTAASVARTWVTILNGGPIKGLSPKKSANTPEVTPGQNPVIVDVAPPPVVTTNVDTLETRIAQLTKAGRPEEALAFARDAVDTNPLAAAPRLCLIRLLAAQGKAQSAADEARRAADLLPEQPSLRIDAVRRLIAVGKLREAHDQINELRVRNPEDKGARKLGAEVALAENDPASAVRELEPILKEGSDPEASLLRGLARALLGGSEGAAADLKAWTSGTKDQAAGYAFAESMLGRTAEKASDAIPALLQRAAVQPKSGAVRDELDTIQRQAQARAAAWAAIPAPEGGQARYDAWSLAHRLMTLVASDLRSYVGGDPEALTAARIDLGEAKRAMKAAQNY